MTIITEYKNDVRIIVMDTISLRYDRGVHVAVGSQTLAVTDMHGRDLGP